MKAIILISALFIQNADIFTSAAAGDYDTTRKIFESNRFLVRAVNDKGETALHVAVKNGQIRIIKYLLSEGFYVNAQDGRLYTPIFTACDTGDVNAAKILIQHGANVNAKGLGNT
ncbi:MAG TPA: ankyrin repeat domain-containing protein, partial [Spirochaetota bacterium]|nr:ankyrin repeat domain-containing protein [Spirochaetota bacterium]